MSGKIQPTKEQIESETAKFNSVPTPELQESQYVHEVYNEIAQHFSQTRYKPWPIVTQYLTTQPAHAFGVDVGCGNGKYISINPSLYIIGSDYSTGLINQAQGLHVAEKNDILVADGMALPHFDDCFEFAISIAVIHHFSTNERRVAAIKEILRVLKKGATALIYCWALEQENSRRGYDRSMEQDVLVPWVSAKPQPKKKKKQQPRKKRTDNQPQEEEPQPQPQVSEEPQPQEEKAPEVKMRYYHLYKEGELKEDCVKAGGEVIDDGYERDNWWAIVKKV